MADVTNLKIGPALFDHNSPRGRRLIESRTVSADFVVKHHQLARQIAESLDVPFAFQERGRPSIRAALENHRIQKAFRIADERNALEFHPRQFRNE